MLDEDFVRGATEKESSARARMLASKWRQQPPGDTSWRPEPTKRVRWYRRGPDRGGRFGRAVGGRWQTPLFLLLALALVAVAMNPGSVKNWFSQHFGGTTGTAQALPSVPGNQPGAQPGLQAPETAPPTSAPTAAPGTPTVADPFAGSPALTWPEGASAIVLPTARPMGYYGSSDVASYLQRVKEFLVDSNLDPSVLAGGYPTAALGLLDPLDTKLVSTLKHELAAPGAKGDGTEFFTRFNPAQARLDGSVVKVQGELSYKGDGQGGLLIHADFTFVYPLLPGPHPDVTAPASAAPASWTTGTTGTTGTGQAADGTDVARSIIRRIIDFDIPDATGFQHTPGTLWPTLWDPDIANTSCGVDDGYVNPQFPGSAQAGPTPSGTPEDPYDRSKLPRALPPGVCGNLSRT